MWGENIPKPSLTLTSCVKFQILSTIRETPISKVDGYRSCGLRMDGYALKSFGFTVFTSQCNLYTPFFPPYRSVHLLSTPVSLALVHSGPSPRVKQSVPHHHGGAAWNDIAGKRSEACEGSACPFGTCSVGALWEEFITKKCNSELQLGSLEKFLDASSSSSSD